MDKNKPDPNIDWDFFRHTTRSDSIRPMLGFKYCKKCKTLKAINLWNFSRDKRSGDGYNSVCKECFKKAYQAKKQKSI